GRVGGTCGRGGHGQPAPADGREPRDGTMRPERPATASARGRSPRHPLVYSRFAALWLRAARGARLCRQVTRPRPPLRILMLAPEPFFEPRGTPFSEYHRIKALVEDGHQVDLVTYPFGRAVDLPNLRIIRTLKPPFMRGVPIDPSFQKTVLVVLLTFTALRVAFAGGVRYDAVHSHEEAGVLGVWLARRLGIPHLYDMH